MIHQTFMAGIATAAFGIIFNVRGKNLVLAAVNGALGYLLYLVFFGNSLIGLFLASASMAFTSELFARLFKSPATVYLAPALVPIVPGGGLFSCVLRLLEGNMSQAVSTGVNTLLEAGAIAVGIILVSSLVKLIPSSFHA